MSQLTHRDLQFVVSRLPRDVRDMVRSNGLYVGGGYIRETIAGGKVNDIDLFGRADSDLDTCANYLAVSREGRTHKTDNAITVLAPPRIPAQFITRWKYDDPVALMDSLDFTVCQAIVWFDAENNRWTSVVHAEFYSDLAARRLVYTFPVREEDAGGSILRIRKFLQRGYNIQAESLGGVISRLVDGMRESGMTHNEKDRALVIAGLLREVDPLVVIDGIDPIDEHRALETM